MTVVSEKRYWRAFVTVPLPELAELLADVTPQLLDAELAGSSHTAALAALHELVQTSLAALARPAEAAPAQ